MHARARDVRPGPTSQALRPARTSGTARPLVARVGAAAAAIAILASGCASGADEGTSPKEDRAASGTTSTAPSGTETGTDAGSDAGAAGGDAATTATGMLRWYENEDIELTVTVIPFDPAAAVQMETAEEFPTDVTLAFTNTGSEPVFTHYDYTQDLTLKLFYEGGSELCWTISHSFTGQAPEDPYCYLETSVIDVSQAFEDVSAEVAGETIEMRRLPQIAPGDTLTVDTYLSYYLETGDGWPEEYDAANPDRTPYVQSYRENIGDFAGFTVTSIADSDLCPALDTHAVVVSSTLTASC